jgi:hypothetical protein
MNLHRRRALELGGPIVALALAGPITVKACATEGSTAGTEIAPGVREIFLGNREIRLARYKLLWMTRLVLTAGAATPPDIVANDTVVLMEQGLLRVRLDEQEFVLCGPGGLWAFPQEAILSYRNSGADTAILRVIELLPGF